jgi:hypothetical protein
LYVVLHISLLVWAIPVLLLNLASPFLFDFLFLHDFLEYAPILALIHAFALVFVITYVGMVYRKVWAFGLCAIHAGWWIICLLVNEESLFWRGLPLVNSG